MVSLQPHEFEVISHMRVREEPWKGDSVMRTTDDLGTIRCKLKNTDNTDAEGMAKEETHPGGAKE